MEFLKSFLFKIIKLTCIPWFLRYFYQYNRVTIILFHNPSYKFFNKVLNELKERYNIISLQDYLLFRYGYISSIPKKALIITFDDGFCGNFQLLPLLKKENFKVSIFLSVKYLDSNKVQWTLIPRKNDVFYLLNLSDKERMKIMWEKYSHFDEKEYDERLFLSKKEIEEMKMDVDFQSHTLTHPILPKTTLSKAKEEIKKSKEILENEFGISTVNSLSFPNNCFSDREIDILKESKFKAALTVKAGYNSNKTDIFKLKRFCLNDFGSIDEAIVKSSGIWAFFKEIKKLKFRRWITA